MYAKKSISIDINKLFKSGLPIESYFLLECLFKSNKDLLELYVDNCGKISKPGIELLIKEGYIEPIENNITFNTLKVTSKSEKLLGKNKLDYDKLFAEFQEIYPKKTPLGRRLNTAPDECKKKYINLIDSIDEHNTHLKCVFMCFNELKSSGRIEYAQAMPAWLNQKNYKVYWDDALKLDNTGNFNSNLENNTAIGADDF